MRIMNHIQKLMGSLCCVKCNRNYSLEDLPRITLPPLCPICGGVLKLNSEEGEKC
jgi:NAD-dependent SIR2 family protein deacetylase